MDPSNNYQNVARSFYADLKLGATGVATGCFLGTLPSSLATPR